MKNDDDDDYTSDMSPFVVEFIKDFPEKTNLTEIGTILGDYILAYIILKKNGSGLTYGDCLLSSLCLRFEKDYSTIH